jgi:hypothetical protein
VRYVVCQPARTVGMCKIRIVSDPKVRITGPFKVWAMRSGAQLVFIENQMARLLKNFYLSGAYHEASGATYMVDWHEMCLIMAEKLGPDDMTRCMQLLSEGQADIIARRKHRQALAYEIFVRSLMFLGHVAWLSVKLVGFVLLVPLIMAIFSRMTKR